MASSVSDAKMKVYKSNPFINLVFGWVFRDVSGSETLENKKIHIMG